MNQDTLNSILIATTVGLLVHAIVQHRKLNCVTKTLGFLLINPCETLSQAQDLARNLGLIDEPDA